MFKKRPLLFFLIPCFGVLFLFLVSSLLSGKLRLSCLSGGREELQPTPQTTLSMHSSHFYTREPYEEVFSKSKPYPTNSNVQVHGGILPHHLLAARLIASFFQGIEQQDVNTIILLGPNHRNLGDYNIALSRAHWETPYGILEPNLAVIDSLLDNTDAGVNERIFETEHSIYNITPFIKRTFPNATVVPIVLRSSTTREEAETLGHRMAEFLGADDLVIASVDFSHNVSQKQARLNDEKSLEVIGTFAFDQIYKLHTDSNPSIYALLTFLSRRRATEAVVLENTNSAEVANDLAQELVTSYVTVCFSRQGLITLMMTGDVILARSVNYQMSRTNNHRLPFERIAETLRRADIAMVNLESPLIKGCPLTDEGMRFCGDHKNVAGLTYAGIDVASLANNHMEDYGRSGAKETEDLLLANGIKPIRNGQTVIHNVKGVSFAFLAPHSPYQSE